MTRGAGIAAISLSAALAAVPAIPAAAFADTAVRGDATATAVDATSSEASATVDGVAYPTIAEAVAAAQDGDTVVLSGAFSNESVKISKSLTFRGEHSGDVYGATLKDVVFTVDNGAALSLDALEVTGASKIADTDASAISLTGCHVVVNTFTTVADQPENAFIYGRSEANGTHFVRFSITDNVFEQTSADGYGFMFDWAVWADGSTVSGNTFGTEAKRINTWLFRIMNVQKDATVLVKDNVGHVADGSGAFNISQNTTKLTSGRIIMSGNTIEHAGRLAHFAQFGPQNEYGHVQLIITADNRYKKTSEAAYRTVTLDDVDRHPNPGAVIVDAVLDAQGKVAGGKVCLGTLTKGEVNATLAEDMVVGDDGNVGADASKYAAQVTHADGSITAYATVEEAVAAANKEDGATFTLLQSSSGHVALSFTKRVNVTAAKGVTFNGKVALGASGSKVYGMTFALDGDDLAFKGNAYASGVNNSIVVGQRAADVEISGNSFSIASMNKGANADFQLNSIWVSQGASRVNIHDNAFSVGRSHNNSAVAVNFVGGSDAGIIEGATVSNNTFTRAADAADVTSGSTMFIVANGNAANKSQYGVKDLAVTGNTVDGGGLTRAYGLSLGNVDGLTVSGNALKGLYMGVSYSAYNPSACKGVVIDGNAFEDNTAPVFLGSATPASEISYTGGNTFDVTDVSTYRGETKSAPYAPTGTIFAGWYKDEALSTPLDAGDVNGAAFAKFVAKDAYAANDAQDHTAIANFIGGALRYGQYQNADGSTDYSKTSIRFGYSFDAPEGTTIAKVVWKWGFGKDDLRYETASTARRDPNSEPLPTDPSWATGNDFIANLVIAGVPLASYDTDIYLQPYVTYETADGTQVTVSGDVEHRDVHELATKISASETGESKDYADGILAALGATANE